MLRRAHAKVVLLAGVLATAPCSPSRPTPHREADAGLGDLGRPPGERADAADDANPAPCPEGSAGPVLPETDPPRCAVGRHQLAFRAVARIDSARRAVLAVGATGNVFIAAARVPSPQPQALGQIDLFEARGDRLVRLLSLPDAAAHEATLASGGIDGLHVAWSGAGGIHHGIVRDQELEAVRSVDDGDPHNVEPNLALGPNGQPLVAFRRSDPGGSPAILLAVRGFTDFDPPIVVRQARYSAGFTSPFVAVDREGVIHLAFDADSGVGARVEYTNNRDGTFCGGTTLDQTAWLPCPSLALEPSGIVHTLFPRVSDGEGPYHLGYARMTTADEWSRPRDVVHTSDGYLSMALSARCPTTGELHAIATWTGSVDDIHRPGMPGERLFHLSSCDGFVTTDAVNQPEEADVALSARAHAMAATADGKVHVVYTVGQSTDTPAVVYAVGEPGRRTW